MRSGTITRFDAYLPRVTFYGGLDVIEVDPVCLKYSLKNNKRMVYTCNEEKLLNVRETNVN